MTFTFLTSVAKLKFIEFTLEAKRNRGLSQNCLCASQPRSPRWACPGGQCSLAWRRTF